MISVKGLKLEIGISMKDILHCIDLGEPYEHIFQNPFYHVIVKDNESKQKISLFQKVKNKSYRCICRSISRIWGKEF